MSFEWRFSAYLLARPQVAPGFKNFLMVAANRHVREVPIADVSPS